MELPRTRRSEGFAAGYAKTFNRGQEEPDGTSAAGLFEAGPRSQTLVTHAVGNPLPEMPLFLAPGLYVTIPLEATYAAAFNGITRRIRDMLSAPG
jgi:hypothetical protein